MTTTQSFSVLPLSEPVKTAIAEDLGWTEPTPVQREAYTPAIKQLDIIVQSRTGTGKTGAFGIPLVDRLVSPEGPFQALVLAPTRELALQSAKELGRLGKRRGIRTAAVYGGAPMQKQVLELEAGAQVVSGTPGRVLDHLRRGTLKPASLRVLVLDEADEMLSMGFAKEINEIFQLLPEERQTLLFSATVDDAIERMADRHMKDPVFIGLSSDQVGATTLDHFVYFVSGRAREQDLIRVLENEDPPSAIIFCNTKVETEKVAQALQHAGFNADWITGDLPQKEREKLMDKTRSGGLRYLVATDVAARGIDISHLTHVINFTFPEAVEQYIHRSGRTGRAGKTGVALSLVSPQELGSLYFLRLRFKIFPIERSLPTRGEEATRREADRIALLEQASPAMPQEESLRLAQRLMTHAHAERLVAGLLAAFFGQQEDLDDHAATARRERRPQARHNPATTAGASEPRSEEPRTTSAQRKGTERKGTERKGTERKKTEPAEAKPADPTKEEMTRLFVNLGRRDGVRAGQLAKFFREEGQLTRNDLGRIRVRDKHAFVEVRTPLVQDALDVLTGKKFGEQEIRVELAQHEATDQ